MSLPTVLAPPPANPVHEAVPDDREPKTRRKLFFWDRAKVSVILLVLLGLSIAVKHGDIPIMSWGDAVRDELRAKRFLLILLAVELVRQLHFLISEHSARYHGCWKRRVWGAWDRRMSKLDPWLRYRLGRLVKVVAWGSIVMLLFASMWGVSFVEAIAQAPARLWSNPFGDGGVPWFFSIIFMLVLSIGQFVAIFWFMSKGGVDTYMPNEVKTRFEDVWGQDRVLEKVKENIDFLDKPAEIEAKGGHVPSGILLWGPPGTGKTLMAQAVAGETGRPYVFVDPGAFQAMFFGVGILKVKALFRKLRKLSLRHGGVIVFFDEADTLGNRGTGSGGFRVTRDEHEALVGLQQCNHLSYVSEPTASTLYGHALFDLRAARAEQPARSRRGIAYVVNTVMGGGGMGTLQALLTELSGLEKPRGFVHRRLRQFLSMEQKRPPKYRILTMFATNLPEALDPALLRPGRIDRMYKVDFPTLDGRVRTFEGYFKKVRHNLSPTDLERLAVMMAHGTGATIKDIVNEALIVAMRNGRDTITWPDVLEAKAFKVYGMADGVAPTELEQFETAIHEAGHAVACYVLRRREVIDIATIEQRGNIGGFVAWVPIEERKFSWRTKIENDIVVSLASLAAERQFFGGENSNGVGGDLNSATLLAKLMLGRAGMGDSIYSVGGDDVEGPQFGRLQKKVEKKLKELYARAEGLVSEHRWFVLAVAHALQRHRTITGEDIDAIYKGTMGPTLDGSVYHREEFRQSYQAYLSHAFEVHQAEGRMRLPLPELSGAFFGPNGNGHSGPMFPAPPVVTPPVSPAPAPVPAPAPDPVPGPVASPAPTPAPPSVTPLPPVDSPPSPSSE